MLKRWALKCIGWGNFCHLSNWSVPSRRTTFWKTKDSGYTQLHDISYPINTSLIWSRITFGNTAHPKIAPTMHSTRPTSDTVNFQLHIFSCEPSQSVSQWILFSTRYLPVPLGTSALIANYYIWLMKVVVGGGWTTVTATPLSSPFWWEIYPVQAQKYCYLPTYSSEPASIHGQWEWETPPQWFSEQYNFSCNCDAFINRW